jgi:hypothetical protein
MEVSVVDRLGDAGLRATPGQNQGRAAAPHQLDHDMRADEPAANDQGPGSTAILDRVAT